MLESPDELAQIVDLTCAVERLAAKVRIAAQERELYRAVERAEELSERTASLSWHVRTLAAKWELEGGAVDE